MANTLPIQPRLAEQAAKDYLAIERAGMLHILSEEIRESIQAYEAMPPAGSSMAANEAYRHRHMQLNKWRFGDGWYLREPLQMANHLAELLECPTSAVTPFVLPEVFDGTTKRTIVLDCLRNVANRARKEIAQPQRRQSA